VGRATFGAILSQTHQKFLRVFPIFGGKIGVFLITNVMINFFQNLALL
jgi:hypothetical protein